MSEDRTQLLTKVGRMERSVETPRSSILDTNRRRADRTRYSEAQRAPASDGRCYDYHSCPARAERYPQTGGSTVLWTDPSPKSVAVQRASRGASVVLRAITEVEADFSDNYLQPYGRKPSVHVSVTEIR